MLKKSLIAVVASALLLLVAGCAGNGNSANGQVKDSSTSVSENQQKVSENTEPVTLTLFMNNLISDADLQRQLFEPLKKKYPYITVVASMKDKTNTLENLITAGTPPDLFNFYVGAVGDLIDADLVEDMTPLAKKNNIDLSRFQPVILDAVRTTSNKGELFGLPRFSNTYALYYNKDIFDKFGVPYPKDGLTWDQTLEIAKKVTRTDGGIHYLGLSEDSLSRPGSSFSLSVLDPKTNKATIDNDKWRKVMQLSKAIYSIPGNIPDPPKPFPGGVTYFTQNGNLAMLASVNNLRQIEPASEKGLNWDLAQYPSFPEAMNIGGKVDVHIIGVTKTSKHKDAAMKVVDLMTSDDIQLIMVRESAVASPLINPEMQKQFGAGAAYLKGKNLQAFFKSKPAPVPPFSPYYSQANSAFTPIFNSYVLGNKDLNTTIREAEDAINKKIADITGK
jgi:multiple sugar transport system substrate-binding protein